jgi:hypothetical protein
VFATVAASKSRQCRTAVVSSSCKTDHAHSLPRHNLLCQTPLVSYFVVISDPRRGGASIALLFRRGNKSEMPCMNDTSLFIRESMQQV